MATEVTVKIYEVLCSIAALALTLIPPLSTRVRFAMQTREKCRYFTFNGNDFSPQQFLHTFRFEKDDLNQLADLLSISATLGFEDRSLSGLEDFCIFLRRLAYPNIMIDVERNFSLSAPYISIVYSHIMHIIHKRAVFILTNLRNVRWLTRSKLRIYSNAVVSQNVPLNNSWGFIDGTARPICRPSHNQEEYYSGHKRVHCVKYQATVCPDGIIVSLKAAFPGRLHDAGIFSLSNFYRELEECVVFPDGKISLCGDSAYPIRELLLKPFVGNNLSPEQKHKSHEHWETSSGMAI